MTSESKAFFPVARTNMNAHKQTHSVIHTSAIVLNTAHHMMFKRLLNSKFLPGEDHPHESYDPFPSLITTNSTPLHSLSNTVWVSMATSI